MIDFLVVITSLFVPSVFSVTNDILLNVTVVEGKTAILPCRVNGDGEYQVIWMNPKKILLSQKESRFIDDPRMSIERPFIGDWNLNIRNVKYEDRGEYTCTVNTPNIETIRVKLIVKVPPKILDYLSSDDIRVKEAEQVKLICNATGKPPPKITWFRRTGDHSKDREQVGNEGETLIIHNISRYCGGIYECEADNQVYPMDKRPISVEVQFPPEIELRNHRIGQFVGKETILVCSITASPQGVNVWKKGNTEISTDKTSNLVYNSHYRTEVYTDGYYTVSLELRIPVITQTDFGNYTCEASNVLGITSATMELYEYKVPTPGPSTIKTTVRGDIIWEEKPIYIKYTETHDGNNGVLGTENVVSLSSNDKSNRRNNRPANSAYSRHYQSKLQTLSIVVCVCSLTLKSITSNL